MSDDNFDPTDSKNRAWAIERAKEQVEYKRGVLRDQPPSPPRDFRADAEMLECLLSIAEERGFSAATPEFVGSPNDWRLVRTPEGETVIVRSNDVDWIFRRVNGCRASPVAWRASIGAAVLGEPVLGEPVDVTETQVEDGAYGLVWTAEDHEEAANSLTSSASAKDAHRRAAARLRALAGSGRTEEGPFVVRWDERYLGPEHAKETPPDEWSCAVNRAEAARFPSYEAAWFARSQCNDGWRKHAVIERVVDPPGPTS